jgi:hypothetical protein
MYAQPRTLRCSHQRLAHPHMNAAAVRFTR